MEKTLDWDQTARIARGMTDEGLEYSIKDALECVRQGVDGGYYLDQISVYRQEQKRRAPQGQRARDKVEDKARIDLLVILSAICRKYGGPESRIELSPEDLANVPGGLHRVDDPETGTIRYIFKRPPAGDSTGS
jgi:hypothetical protein